MKRFFLLSIGGRLTRSKYIIHMIIAYCLQTVAGLDSIPRGLGLILGLLGLCWVIYAIVGRLHDLGYPGWIGWIWLLLQILSLFGEGISAIVSILCLILGITLLFSKGQEEDNEYGPNPYIEKENEKEVEKSAKKSKKGEIGELIRQEEEILKQKKKSVTKKKAIMDKK